MATRRLCKINPDDLNQSWDCRTCKRGVSSASFQLLKLETGTHVGLFSLPHPLHPPSANPADTPGSVLSPVPIQTHHPCQAMLLGHLAQPWSPAGVGNSALKAFPPVSTWKSFQTSNQIKDRLLELPKTSDQAWDEISTLSRVSRGLLWPGPAGLQTISPLSLAGPSEHLFTGLKGRHCSGPWWQRFRVC